MMRQSKRIVKTALNPSARTVRGTILIICTVLACAAASELRAQNQRGPGNGPGFDGPPPGNFGGPPGGGGPPMGMQEARKLVPQFDKDGDKRLNVAERKAAREFLAKEKTEGRGPRQCRHRQEAAPCSARRRGAPRG